MGNTAQSPPLHSAHGGHASHGSYGGGNHHQYSASSQLLREKKRRKKRKDKMKNRMILANDDGQKVRMNGYMSGGSAASIQSEPASNKNSGSTIANTGAKSDGGILGSITSMAYGYIMGGSTPGGY